MNNRGEFGIEEALLELVILGIFVILMFTIGGRAASSNFVERDLLGQNVQRLSQMLSFAGDVQLEYDFPLFSGAKFSSIGAKDSQKSVVTVGFVNDSKTFSFEHHKNFGSVISVNAEEIPVTISSGDGAVNSGIISMRSFSCNSNKDFSRAQIFSSVSMESFSQVLNRISPSKYSPTYTIQTPPTSPNDISDDFVILFSKTGGSSVKVLMNSKTSEGVKTDEYSCFIAKNIQERGIPVIIGFVNPDSESDESVALPNNKAGVEISVPESMDSSQLSILQGVFVS
ncbi:hypothetical protein HY483_00485 [Candidatus Woesearchaeota archaeon]|nr:hypothetical protein [Candidatus Woesearchaeota archaeon]